MQGASEMGSKDPRKERRSQGSPNSYQGLMTIRRDLLQSPLEAIEKWDDYHENKRKAKKRKMVEMWDDTIRPEL